MLIQRLVSGVLWAWVLVSMGPLFAEDKAASIGEQLEKLTRYELLTPQRIAALPSAEQAAWNEYLARSHGYLRRELETLAGECRAAGLANSRPAPSNSQQFEFDRKAPEVWFKGPESENLAFAVASYQTPTGGWSKAVDYSQGRRPPGTHWTTQSGAGWHYCGTLDNRSTTEQIRFLSAYDSMTELDVAGDAAKRGVNWILESQYPSGGWPQNYPIESGYHEAVTLNDDAMLHAMELILEIGQGEGLFDQWDPAIRKRCLQSYERAVVFLAKSQVRVDGMPTVWGAQHDPLSLVPVGARIKEPPSLSGAESASLLKFLMRTAPPSETTTELIEPALRWLDAHRVTGLRKTKNAAGKTDYVRDPDSKEVYWARFYSIETGAPLFAGAQDGVIYSTFSEMAAHNKVAYDYFTTKPSDLLTKEVVRWRKRLQTPE